MWTQMQTHRRQDWGKTKASFIKRLKSTKTKRVRKKKRVARCKEKGIFQITREKRNQNPNMPIGGT